MNAQQGAQGQPGQAGQAGKGGAGQKGSWNTISQTPWFSDQSIQKQLNLKNEQSGQLNKAYSQAWNNYQSGLKELNSKSDLSAEDRAKRTRELESNFYKSFSTSAEDALSDPALRQRFNQMSWQYRGYGAFNDPMIQEKLNLTPEQRQKLNQYNQEWTTQMNELNGAFSKDQNAANKQYTEMHRQFDERLKSVLNEQQLSTYRQLTGEPYNFPPSAYFSSARQGSGTSGKNDR